MGFIQIITLNGMSIYGNIVMKDDSIMTMLPTCYSKVELPDNKEFREAYNKAEVMSVTIVITEKEAKIINFERFPKMAEAEPAT